jgi:hypothetical protein
MPIAIFILILLSTLNPSENVIDSMINNVVVATVHDNLGKKWNANKTVHFEIEQEYFADVAFYRIHPTNIIVWPPKDQMRIAIDNDFTGYPLYGLRNNAFNKIIGRHPIEISKNNICEYGLFYLDVCYDPGIGPNTVIENVAEFIDSQYQRFAEHHTLRDKSWEEEKPNIVKACETIKLPLYIQDDINRVFIVDYYKWCENNGDIVHVQLKIWFNGECEIKKEEVIATAIGYW